MSEDKAKNVPIEQLLREYTEECCDFTNMDWVIKVSRTYADRMPDSQVRCLMHTMAYHLKTSDEDNVDIRKALAADIYKYVIDETGYLISLPDDVIKGIIKLVQDSSLTVEEPNTWFSLEKHGPPDDNVSVITWNGHDMAFDMWSNKESENLNMERILSTLGDGDIDIEPRKITHWMYKPTTPKED